jgi:hypothetical protein
MWVFGAGWDGEAVVGAVRSGDRPNSDLQKSVRRKSVRRKSVRQRSARQLDLTEVAVCGAIKKRSQSRFDATGSVFTLYADDDSVLVYSSVSRDFCS